MVVKNQKNLIHDVVMNYIPKKKTDPPKISIEQMVKDHTKLLAETGGAPSKVITNIAQPTQNVFNEIEKKVIDKPIKISKVEPVTISDIVMSLGGEIQKKPNSRRRSRNNVKSTVEKLIDSKLKSEFIENLINNNMDKKEVTHKVKSPVVSYNIPKQPELKSKLHISTNNIHKKIENHPKSPITKKFKSENNITHITQAKDQLLKPISKKNSNSIIVNPKGGYDNRKQNRTNSYLKDTVLKTKKESEINLKSFRDYEIKISNSHKNSKNSKKSERKTSKKSKGSKKHSTRKSKNKYNGDSCNIQLDKGVPNYLKIDLQQLIGNGITINNDNFNFNKHSNSK